MLRISASSVTARIDVVVRQQPLHQRVDAEVAAEAAAGADRLPALGAVGAADADPLLDAPVTYKLQVTSYKLQFTIYNLQVTSYKLQFTRPMRIHFSTHPWQKRCMHGAMTVALR